MPFVAKIKPDSQTWTEWRGQAKVQATLENVVFRWVPGDDYVSDLLTAPQHAEMKKLGDVELVPLGGSQQDPPLRQQHGEPVVAAPGPDHSEIRAAHPTQPID